MVSTPSLFVFDSWVVVVDKSINAGATVVVVVVDELSFGASYTGSLKDGSEVIGLLL